MWQTGSGSQAWNSWFPRRVALIFAQNTLEHPQRRVGVLAILVVVGLRAVEDHASAPRLPVALATQPRYPLKEGFGLLLT